MSRGFFREYTDAKPVSFDEKELGFRYRTLGTKKCHLTLHSKFGPATILVDHDEENHQKDAGKGSKSDRYGYLVGAKRRDGQEP